MPEARGPRAFWSGTIAFGLVTVPVDLMAANRSRRVSLRMLAPDGTPLSRRYWCPKDERFAESAEIVRGYEIENDEYVVVTDEELTALEPEKSREIDLRRFVPRASLDPVWFERAYFLAPGAESTKAYRLLAEAMEAADRAGIGTFVMRGKEHLVAILAEDGILRAQTLRFADEVRSPEDVAVDAPHQPEAKRVREIARAIEALAEDELDPDELEDRYSERVRRLAEEKLEREEDVVELPEEVRAEEEEEPDVIDLMAILKRRLGREAVPQRAAPEREERRELAPEDLEQRTKKELYAVARDLDIEGRSAMTKEELIDAIRRTA